MQYTVEKSLSAFEFWSGAKETAKELTNEQLDQMESILEDCYPDGMTDTQINDIFWFEQDWIAEMLGFRSWEDLIGIEDEEEDPEEDEDE
jgi:hypothetical protein